MRLTRFALVVLIAIPGVLMAQRMTGLRETEPTFLLNPPEVYIRAIEQDLNTRIGPPALLPPLAPSTANIEVTYIGFSAEAQAAFQFAVDIWSTVITSPATIRVTARWTPLDPGVLGSAGASSLIRDFSGAPVPGTWYPISLAEKLAGGDLNSVDSADITARFNSTQSGWYFGTDGNPPSGQFDMVTVVLHELGHGLGFFGSMNVASGMGSWGAGTGFPFIFDRFAENGANQQLINTTIFPNPSAALASQLTGNNIFFDGPRATAENGGTPPKLYAPSTWNSGSSFSHLDETQFPAGNPNSLMTPALGSAEAIHSPGNITLGMFDDWGWTTTPPAPSDVKWEEIFGGTSPPAGWRVVDNDGSGSALSFEQLIAFTSGDTVRPQAGTSFWFSSWQNANGSGLIDEWLIGPRVPMIEDGDSLFFWAGAIGDLYDDSLRVFVSTTDSALGSFVNQIGYFRVDGPPGSWHRYGFDLSAFAGEEIFVAVNYFIVDGGGSGSNSDNVWIDHFLITTQGAVSVAEEGNLPSAFILQQNYPNPFNPATTIGYELSAAADVHLRIFDLLGREVAELVREQQQPGVYAARWDASGMASGLYFYRLTAGGVSQTRSMLLVR